MLNAGKRKVSDDAAFVPAIYKTLQNDEELFQEGDSPKPGSEAKNKVNNLLPKGYNNIIVTASSKVDESGHDAVYGCIRLPIVSKADALRWIKKFELETSTSYTMQKTWQKDPASGLFKSKFVCNYQHQPDSTTNCKACLIFTIKDPKEIEGDPDYYLRDYPSQVVLQFCHNHKIVKHVRPSKELYETFQAYYRTGHSPFSALVCHKCDLHSLYGPEFYNVVSSYYRCPPYNWCCREYFKTFKQDFTCPSEEELAKSLDKMVREYNENCGAESAVLSENSLTLCSPLMKRVFALGFADDLVTIRCFTAAKLAPKAQKILLFLCHTPIGSLPFGVILISGSEIQQGIATLLQMLGTPSYSPKNIIIDENFGLSDSLKLIFPETRIIFNEFQMLQSIWRMVRLVSEDNHEEFQSLYHLFLLVLESRSEEDYENNCASLQVYMVKYPKLEEFFENFKQISDRYVAYCRPKVEFNIDMLNYTDSGTIILQDVAIKYSKRFNIVQLFDFLTKNYVTHYERKLKKIVNGDLKGFYKTNFYVPLSKVSDFTCQKINHTEFVVRLNEAKFFVNAELDTCTCQVGVHGGSCIHQYIVENNLGLVPECYTPLEDDMLGIFKSVLGSVVENCDHIEDLNENSCYDGKTSSQEDHSYFGPVMENGNLSVTEPPKINILSSVIIKPSKLEEQSKQDSTLDLLTDEQLDVTEIDSDTVAELASKDLDVVNTAPITNKDSALVERLSLAFSQLSELAATKKFQEPIENFLNKFKELASSDRLIEALESFGQPRPFFRRRSFSTSDSEYEDLTHFEHYSDCRSSCSEFHSELEEIDDEDCEQYISEDTISPPDVTEVKLPPGIRLTKIPELNKPQKVEVKPSIKVSPMIAQPVLTPKTDKALTQKPQESKAHELEQILMGEDEDKNSEQESSTAKDSKNSLLKNDELSFLFSDPRFEAVLLEDPPDPEEEKEHSLRGYNKNGKSLVLIESQPLRLPLPLLLESSVRTVVRTVKPDSTRNHLLVKTPIVSLKSPTAPQPTLKPKLHKSSTRGREHQRDSKGSKTPQLALKRKLRNNLPKPLTKRRRLQNISELNLPQTPQPPLERQLLNSLPKPISKERSNLKVKSPITPQSTLERKLRNSLSKSTAKDRQSDLEVQAPITPQPTSERKFRNSLSKSNAKDRQSNREVKSPITPQPTSERKFRNSLSKPTATDIQSDSGDSEILNLSRDTTIKKRGQRPPMIKRINDQTPSRKKTSASGLELIVLLERNIHIELLCQTKMEKKSPEKIRRGYKELLESAKKLKQL